MLILKPFQEFLLTLFLTQPLIRPSWREASIGVFVTLYVVMNQMMELWNNDMMEWWDDGMIELAGFVWNMLELAGIDWS